MAVHHPVLVLFRVDVHAVDHANNALDHRPCALPLHCTGAELAGCGGSDFCTGSSRQK